MIFIKNKYTTWYYNIINNAKSRNITEGYTENHHIIPKSLGGNNSKDNLVTLTAREHFICHWLLPKMLNGTSKRSMYFALNAMIRHNETQDRHIVTSRQYRIVREQFAKHIGEHNKNIKRKSRSPEAIEQHRKKITGLKRSQEAIEKL